MKTALITGITGQDGSYLAELLIKKGYRVAGLVSKKYNIGWQNVDHIKKELLIVDGDLLDKQSLVDAFHKVKPAEVYNLGGLSFLPACWEKPALAFDINALGTLRLLDIIKEKYAGVKFYQASSAKMFGSNAPIIQNENTPLSPEDPYSISKACAHFITKNYRENYKIFAVSGILYNHESVRRGPEFVTRKITLAAAKIKLGFEKKLKLGDINAQADWGWAPDYVRAMYLMMTSDKPQDFVIATGRLHQVKDICQIAFDKLGLDYKKYIVHDKMLIRHKEVHALCGSAKKAKQLLGWSPTVSFRKMIEDMVIHDYELLKIEGNKP